MILILPHLNKNLIILPEVCISLLFLLATAADTKGFPNDIDRINSDQLSLFIISEWKLCSMTHSTTLMTIPWWHSETSWIPNGAQGLRFTILDLGFHLNWMNISVLPETKYIVKLASVKSLTVWEIRYYKKVLFEKVSLLFFPGQTIVRRRTIRAFRYFYQESRCVLTSDHFVS